MKLSSINKVRLFQVFPCDNTEWSLLDLYKEQFRTDRAIWQKFYIKSCSSQMKRSPYNEKEPVPLSQLKP